MWVLAVEVGLLLYADDLLLCAPTSAALARLAAACEQFCTDNGLTISTPKCALLPIMVTPDPLCIAGQPVRVVASLSYLGL